MSPRAQDVEYQGVALPKMASPLQLISHGAELIERLFIDEDKILPNLPPEFHCGRFIGVPTKLGVIDIEWSKKILKKVIFHCSNDGILNLQFQKTLKTFRLREDFRQRGEVRVCGEGFEVKADKTYYLDNFRK